MIGTNQAEGAKLFRSDSKLVNNWRTIGLISRFLSLDRFGGCHQRAARAPDFGAVAPAVGGLCSAAGRRRLPRVQGRAGVSVAARAALSHRRVVGIGVILPSGCYPEDRSAMGHGFGWGVVGAWRCEGPERVLQPIAFISF